MALWINGVKQDTIGRNELSNFTEIGSDVFTITGGTDAVVGSSGLTIQMNQASKNQAGYLSSSDFTYFDKKVNRIGFYGMGMARTLNLATADATLKGFAGGFTDGKYGYFVPANNGTAFGMIARVDLSDFTTAGVTTLNLATADATLKGFQGGFTDGKYGYFVPYNNGTAFGTIARVDLSDFTTAGITTLNLATADSTLKGFAGGFTDGKYGYFVPNFNGAEFGTIARVDLSDFTTAGITTLNLATADSILKGFAGGFTDGKYGYFVPSYNGADYFGKIARVDLSDFTTAGITILNLATADATLKGFAGGFTDGRYGYFVPEGGYFGTIARVDLSDFTTAGITTLNLATVDGALGGFRGGFTDSKYGYFVPNFNGIYRGMIARVDLNDFTTAGVTTLNLAASDATLKGFRGGFFDGKYGYFVPYYNGTAFGTIARINCFFSGGF